ncbi:MAG: phage tail sheath family protein, partial [Sphingobacteriaceae bacterium]
LTGLWKQGALAGAKAEEAFSVSVGLGSTMVATDILDGYLDVAILLAVTHPAEFIEISFKQQLQTS